MKKLLIFGAGETATIAAEFFLVDSSEKLDGFVVDDQYFREGFSLHGYPVFPLSLVLQDFPPEKYKIFVAISYSKLNRDRKRAFQIFLKLGYEFATYISSKATVWRTASIGSNCMIFEGNNIQHNVVIGDNVILWAGNHVGHGAVICDSTYISSHVCMAGYSKIGEHSFLGINASVIDNVEISDDCFIAAGSVVNRNTESNGVYSGNPAQKNPRVTALRYFKVKDGI